MNEHLPDEILFIKAFFYVMFYFHSNTSFLFKLLVQNFFPINFRLFPLTRFPIQAEQIISGKYMAGNHPTDLVQIIPRRTKAHRIDTCVLYLFSIQRIIPQSPKPPMPHETKPRRKLLLYILFMVYSIMYGKLRGSNVLRHK